MINGTVLEPWGTRGSRFFALISSLRVTASVYCGQTSCGNCPPFIGVGWSWGLALMGRYTYLPTSRLTRVWHHALTGITPDPHNG